MSNGLVRRIEVHVNWHGKLSMIGLIVMGALGVVGMSKEKGLLA